jgi:hypothetical protein
MSFSLKVFFIIADDCAARKKFFVIFKRNCYNLRGIKKAMRNKRGGIFSDGEFCVVNVAADYHDNPRTLDEGSLHVADSRDIYRRNVIHGRKFFGVNRYILWNHGIKSRR